MRDSARGERVALVFPGVGVRFRGEEADFFRRHRERMAPFLAEASSWAGTDLIAALEAGAIVTLDERARELFTQAFNCAAGSVFRDRGVIPSWVAGHSLGIYSALTVSGAVTFVAGLAMVDRARALVREACRQGSFGMGVAIGLTEAETGEILAEKAFASLAMAGINSEVSVVVSGARSEVEAFLAESEARGAVKVVLLDIDMPYHNPRFLAGTREPFREFLRGLSWKEPSCPVISSLDHAALTDPDDLLDYTAFNLSTPINWQKVVETLSRLGAGEVIECGPGISLTQNAHFISEAPHHVNLQTSRRRLGI